jgi:beta-galactosidase GanA
MTHLRGLDEQDETVIMVQVENEIGLLGAAREWGDAANDAFASLVPGALLTHLAELDPSSDSPLHDRWRQASSKRNGTWVEIFGDGVATDEIFTAWHYARYVEAIAAAGRAAYPIPLFVNAALNLLHKAPGEYPSGGPLPHVWEAWKLAAPSLDLLCPDIYFPEFEYWASKYVRPQNPLFIPEIQRSQDCGAQAIYAVGELRALGFSPSAIEGANGADANAIKSSYDILHQVSPLLFRHRAAGTVRAVLLDKTQQRRELLIGDTIFRAAHDFTCPWTSGDRSQDVWPLVSCLVITISDSEFVFAGTGTIFTFAHQTDCTANIGLLSVAEGHYEGGRWVLERRLNGDETHQGRHLRIPYGKWGIQKLKLYRY